MLTLQQIIIEVDVTVPNEYEIQDKVSWLNNINQDFFNVVKIPKIARFVTTNSNEYALPDDVRAKNIDLVQVGLLEYRSLLDDNVKPTQNNWSFDDSTRKISLFPAPYRAGEQGKVRYHRIATTTLLASNLSATPDAPSEYHWTYIPALCERIALAMDDGVKAANFANQYRAAWNVAAANYRSDAI